MAITGTITTNFKDENGLDLGKQLIEKDYLIQVYPRLVAGSKSAGLWCWGSNANGLIGDQTKVTTITARSSPIQTIALGTNWMQPAVGGTHCGCIKTDGTLWVWGANTNGRLGDNTSVSKSSPIQVVGTATTWYQFEAGGNNSVAVKTDGTLWCWGLNTNGQVGDNTVTARSSPVQTVTFATNWKQAAAGSSHIAAVKTDGTLWCWGLNTNGQLGDNTITHRSSPVQTVALGSNWQQVSCGATHTAALKADGTLWIWGNNTNGRLGDNTIVSKSSPVQTVTFATNWKKVSCGSGHTSAVKTDGTLWCWGLNTNGQVGDNTVTARSSPVQTVTTTTNWRDVDAGDNHTVSQKTDGSLWGWGINTNGQLGDNTITHRSSPVQTVAAGQSWKQFSAGQTNTMSVEDFNY